MLPSKQKFYLDLDLETLLEDLEPDLDLDLLLERDPDLDLKKKNIKWYNQSENFYDKEINLIILFVGILSQLKYFISFLDKAWGKTSSLVLWDWLKIKIKIVILI